MKKLLYYIIAIVMLMLPVTSCDDVLDKQSVDSFNEQVVFSDINVVKAYLGKCYDRMGGNTNAGILGMREDLLSSATDQTLCIHRPANYVNLKGTQSPDQLGFFASNGMGGYLRWPNLYANIQNINNILANIDDFRLQQVRMSWQGVLKVKPIFSGHLSMPLSLCFTEVSFFHPSHGN